MKQMLLIRCKNNKKVLKVNVGSTLSEVFSASELKMDHGPVCARVNNKVQGMHYRLYNDKDVEFLDMRSGSGSRTYTRTLFFICCKAINDLYGNVEVRIDIPVSKGYYVHVNLGRDITADDVARIRCRMQEIIDADTPIRRRMVTAEEAIRLFSEKGDMSKVKLLKGQGKLYTVYYQIDDFIDYFYGALLTSTSEVYLFDLVAYSDGMLLRVPSREDPGQLCPMPRQQKMFDVFKEHHEWQNIIGLRTVGDLNDAVDKGFATDIINVNEALQEKKIARIADQIAARHDVKLVLLAGPSSSGKTTTCKRLSIQLLTCGLKPLQISLDDYFIDRDKTPLDANGEYDYESIHALNIALINEQFNALFKGEEIELPRYNFQAGKSEKSGKRLKLGPNDIVVVEGIHALNPELTAQIPEQQKFRVYVSALTTILLDEHNYIPTTDNRLLRRIIRDYKYRGVSAQESIHRWPSVRAGEERWIFPYQENADVMFNSSLFYEISVLRRFAEPILREVPDTVPEYGEAKRMLKFLDNFIPISPEEIPPTSLLREFIGGSSFKY